MPNGNSHRYPTFAQFTQWFAAAASITGLIWGCSGTEKAIFPLGFGPLARAEQSEQAKATPLQQDSSTNKRARIASRLEAPARQPSFTIGTVERTVRPSATESPSPSASALSTSPPGPAPKLADWLGLWRGKDTTRYLIPTFPSEAMDDPNARIRVESSLGQQIKLVLIDSSNEKDLCTLTAQVEGLVAKIEPGQPCFSTEDVEGGLSVHVKTGQGTLRDSTLTLDLTLDADVQTEQFQSKGTVEYHFEGKRS